MSTVTFKDGILAADRRATRDGIICRIRKLDYFDDSFWGYVGTTEGWLLFKQQYIDPSIQVNIEDDDVSVIQIKGKRIYRYNHTCVPVVTVAPFFALGSGSHFATGAMAQGATAIEAIKITSKFDVYTGGGIDWRNTCV